MTDTPAPNERFDELLSAACEGTLTRDETAELEAIIQADDDARRKYIAYVTIDAALRWEDAVGATADFRPNVDEPEDRGQETGDRGQETGDSKQETEVSGPHQSPLTSHQSPVTAHQSPVTAHQSPLRSLDRSLLRHRAGIGIAAGLVFVATLIGWAAMTYLPGLAKNEKGADDKAEFVAQLVHEVNTKWNAETIEHPTTHNSQPIETGLRLFADQKLSLAAGAALIKFKNGAEVLLEGPAEFEVGGEKTCRLEFGKLVARCPTKRSQGFAVQMPTGHVTDLGTEFGVEVALNGRCLVRVYDGRVSVQPRDGSEARELAANEALALTPAAGGAVYFAPATVAAHAFMRPRHGTKSIGEHIHDNTVQTDLYSAQMNGIPVASDDLVQAGAATLAAANAIEFVSNQGLEFAYINDGKSAARGNGVFEFEGHDGAQWIAEFVLDTSTNTVGYDITQIDSIASWIQGRIQQHVTVTYSTVDEPEHFKNLLGTFTNIHKVPQTTGSSRLRLTDVDGGVLATRVKAIRLLYTNHGLARNYQTIIQEVDVLGSATPTDADTGTHEMETNEQSTNP